MRLPKILRRPLGVLRRKVVGDAFGWYVGFQRYERGFLFVAHRDTQFIEMNKCVSYDVMRYWKNALFGRTPASLESALSRITALAHSLEKGLAFPQRKQTFGVRQVEELLALLQREIVQDKGGGDPRIVWAMASLKEWFEHHKENSAIPVAILQSCQNLLSRFPEADKVPTAKVCTRAAIQSAARGDFESLVHSRHSVRNFSSEPVDISFINQAVALASRSPSACNRQAIRVICLSNGDDMKAALSLQNGNRGFSDCIDKLLIVAADARCFLEHHERNQGYVDAGIFSMSLVHALHYLGLGTCCLNWSVDRHTDEALHEAVRIPAYLVVACFIAVGQLPDRFTVAASNRLPPAALLEVRG